MSLSEKSKRNLHPELISNFHEMKTSTRSERELLQSLGFNILAHSVQALLYAGVIQRIYSKNKHSLEPIHVFELNNLSNWALMAVVNILTLFDVFFYDSDIFCPIIHFGQNYIRFSFYVGIILTQIDRFLALYLNVKYKSRVTKDDALKTVVISKAILFVVTLMVIKLDGKILECFSSTFFGCRMLKGNLMFVNLPMFVTLVTVIAVSIYVLACILKQRKKVAPTVNIKTVSRQVEEEDLTVVDLENEEADEKKIKRRNEDPFMFYRENPVQAETGVATTAFKCFETSIFEPAMWALKINLVTLSLLIMMVPHNILNVYFYLTSGGECTSNIVIISRVVGVAQYIFVLIYPFILMSKLNRLSS